MRLGVLMGLLVLLECAVVQLGCVDEDLRAGLVFGLIDQCSLGSILLYFGDLHLNRAVLIIEITWIEIGRITDARIPQVVHLLG